MTFLCEYYFTDACVSEYLTDNTGEIESPNYPSDYPHNADCIWQITLQEGQQIMIEFHDMDIEKRYDRLLIGEGTDPDSDEYTVNYLNYI